MKKLNLAIGLSLGVLAVSPGLADSPISFTDAANDVSYPVIDLQAVSVNVTDDTITATLTVGDLPSQLPVNHPDTSVGHLEYNWEVWFDVNQNNVLDSGDIIIVTLFSKSSEPSQQGSILEEGNNTLWEIIDDDSNSKNVGNSDTSIEANTITLSVDKSIYAGLTAITQATPFRFRTDYYYGGEQGTDFAPDTSWFSMNNVQLVDNNQPPPFGSTRTSHSEYDKGYEAGLSKCDASFSPSEGSVHIPCVEVPTEEGTIMYKVDMKQVLDDPEQLLFSVLSAEPVQ